MLKTILSEELRGDLPMSTHLDKIVNEYGSRGIPDAIAKKVRELDDTSFREGEKASYDDDLLGDNWINLTAGPMGRLDGNGPLMDLDFWELGNELFHAYFDQHIEENAGADESCKWVYDMMVAEGARYKEEKLDKVEEAMSETLANLTNEFGRAGRMGQPPKLGYKFMAEAPKHNDKGAKWANKVKHPNADKRISYEVYLLCIWLMYYGCEEPDVTGFADRKAAMRAKLEESSGVTISPPSSQGQ